MATALSIPHARMSMWSHASRLRLAVAKGARPVAQPSRPRVAHFAPRASAGNEHANDIIGSGPFTVTTPLYYVNAGERR